MTIESFLSELEKTARDRKINTSVFLIHKINSVRKKHIKSKEEEMAISCLISNIKIKKIGELRAEIIRGIKQYKEARKIAEEKIIEFASQKIFKGSVVFSCGHSDRVINAIKRAGTCGVEFSVHTIDAGTDLEGRKAAEEISLMRIKTRHFPDIAANKALEKVDVLFFEPESVTENKIMVPFGVNAVLEEAKKQNVSVYCIYNSLAGGSKNKQWPKQKTPEHLHLMGGDAEESKTGNITGVITGQGILTVSQFLRQT